ENARLYEAIRDNEERLEREVRFAQRVQLALLPRDLPKKVRGVDVAWHFDPARELGGDLYEFQSPEPHTLVVALGDVSGKGVPAALYGAFVGEVIRSRTLRRRLAPDRISPNAVLTSINRIMHERQLEEYYCTLCYALFDLRKRHVTLSNSGLPYPIRASGDTIGQIELPGLPLGSFGGSTYDEISFDLNAGDLFVFCSDGIFEAWDTQGREFGADGIINAIAGSRDKTADEVVSAVFNAMQAFRGGAEQADDQTVVAVRITQ
ncbi:MAG TPA: PP2C family protein-serine/threonine phosphatase, partial [Vicinamibacterales bacterium]|nr:PP2C family protein-serine/threonine phosphatase [Vicinamibacterales bacterium]